MLSKGMTIPSRADGTPILASSAATARSQATRIWQPAPSAAPSTRATTGKG